MHDVPRSTAHGSRPEESPIWLAHHWPGGYDRCVAVGRWHVCRRCAVLYPVAVVAAIAVVAIDPPLTPLIVAMWLLPIPTVAEWIGEHLGSLSYSARRQVLLSLVAAPALGIALGLHALAPFNLAATAPVLTYSLVCFAAVVVGRIRELPDVDPDWEEHHLEAEAARRQELEALLESADRREPVTPAEP